MAGKLRASLLEANVDRSFSTIVSAHFVTITGCFTFQKVKEESTEFSKG